MDRVRVGFVGVGNMGQCAHLKQYASLPECEVVAIAEMRPHLRERVAARYGVPRTYASHEEMLSAETLDAIVAPQQFTRHGLIVPDILRYGLPLFTEKPLASSVQVGERIVAALAESDSFLMLGYHKRSDLATAYARAEIERLRRTGGLGALRYVRITMPPGDWVAGGFCDLVTTDEPRPTLETDPPPPDMSPDAFQRYVTLVNYYIHQINLLRYLLGEPYRVAYAAPSGVLLAAESESGVSGVIEMAPYRTTLGWDETALVGFERGYIRLELPAPLASGRAGTVTVYRDPGEGATPEATTPTLPPVGAMRQQAANFLAAVRGEAPPPCTAEEALEDLRVARDYQALLEGAAQPG